MSDPLPLPSARQLNWHTLEMYGFLHFTVNTFTGLEWGYGDEAETVFHPTDFDADQIVETAQSGGLRGLILTCKHHDGFCLWPSAHTSHSVRGSAWRSGKGDVAAEISAACARRGLRFGIYLSPWDRNHAAYGRAEYIPYFRKQLEELLTGYGPLFEVWFDGANGGDGYYGGANETRKIDISTYYDWQATWDLVRRHQPQACIFSDAGPDIRWVGNERGIAGDPCWPTLSPAGLAPGLADAELLNRGERSGTHWLPAECDVSIRPGWFYHAEEDDLVKTPAELEELYYCSVGRGASLLLNLPPDRRGRIPAADAAALKNFGALLSRTFAVDLARGAAASSPQGAQGEHAAGCALDGSPLTYWTPERTPADADSRFELLVDLPQPATFDVVSLREHLALGARVDSFALDAWRPSGWEEIAHGQSIGSRRLLRCSRTEANRLRLRLQAGFPPAVRELALHLDG
jgi:alpha-L-fucosidase